MIIRQGTMEDIHSCRELFFLGQKDHPVAYDGISVESIEKDLKDGLVTVADEDGVVGMISAVPLAHKTLLYMLVCKPEYRKGRLAPQLIRYATSRFGKVYAITVPHAEESFHKAGFEITGFVMENA